MKSLIAILTSLHVLAHGIFGCCGHGLVAPAQAAELCECHHLSHPASHHGDHQHEHSPDSRDVADEDSPPHEPHQCVHASCHWLASDASQSFDPFDFSTPHSFVAILPTSSVALHAAEFWPDAAANRTAAPPLRLHLALGVLLI